MKPKPISWTTTSVIKAILFIFATLMARPAIVSLTHRFMLSDSVQNFLAMLILYGVSLSSVFFFGPKIKGERLRELGLTTFKLAEALIYSINWLIAIKIFSGFYVVLTEKLLGFRPAADNFDLVPKIFGQGPPGLILAVLMTVLIAPVVEEIFFRGFIYPALRDKIGITWAAVLSSFIFALFHGDPWLIAPMMLLGLALVHLLEREGSLWPAIFLHAIYNLTTILIIYL